MRDRIDVWATTVSLAWGHAIPGSNTGPLAVLRRSHLYFFSICFFRTSWFWILMFARACRLAELADFCVCITIFHPAQSQLRRYRGDTAHFFSKFVFPRFFFVFRRFFFVFRRFFFVFRRFFFVCSTFLFSRLFVSR